MKTLIGSSVRARSATGQVSKSLGRKTVNFDISGIAASVNMEVLKISKPIVSAGKMVRSGRRIVVDEHDSFIEDKKTVKRVPVELTRVTCLRSASTCPLTLTFCRRNQC